MPQRHDEPQHGAEAGRGARQQGRPRPDEQAGRQQDAADEREKQTDQAGHGIPMAGLDQAGLEPPPEHGPVVADRRDACPLSAASLLPRPVDQAVLPARMRRRATSLPSSHSTSRTRAGRRAQPNWPRVIGVVWSRRWKMSIWVTSTASTNSARSARFICLLSNVAVVRTVPVSLRHSRAATMRQSAKEVNATERATSRPPNWDVPHPSSARRPTVIASPASPTVTTSRLVSTDSPRGRGCSDISPGLSRSKPRAKPKAALTTKWIHSTCAGENGSPAAMLNTAAPRKVSTNTTSRTRTNRMYLVRLS